jgi:AcrR family transcriptional regulator
MELTRREREKIAKKETILNAAQHVFAEKGFHAATLDEIAELAEFSKAAIYLYFKNKEDLFFKLIGEKINEICREIDSIAKTDKDPIEKLKTIVNIHLEFHMRHTNFYKIIARIKSDMETVDQKMESRLKKEAMCVFSGYIDSISNIMKQGIEKGYFNCDNGDLLSYILTGILNSVWFKNAALNSTMEDLRAHYNLAFEIFLNGAIKR